MASLRPLDAAMGYLVLWDKHVVNGGIVCAVGAVGVAATCLSMFVGIDNKRSRTQSPDTWNVTSDTWNGTQTHPQIKSMSHRNNDGFQNHGNHATLQAHI